MGTGRITKYGQYPTLDHLVLDELTFLYEEVQKVLPGSYRAPMTIDAVREAIAAKGAGLAPPPHPGSEGTQYPTLNHLVLDELTYLYADLKKNIPGSYRAPFTIERVRDAIREAEDPGPVAPPNHAG